MDAHQLDKNELRFDKMEMKLDVNEMRIKRLEKLVNVCKAKCDFCSRTLTQIVCHDNEGFYCPIHGLFSDLAHVNFFYNQIKVRNKHRCSRVDKPCPVVFYEGSHSRESCRFAHSPTELAFWTFLEKTGQEVQNLFPKIPKDDAHMFNYGDTLFNLIYTADMNVIIKFFNKSTYEQIFCRDENCQTIFHVACKENNGPLIRLLIDKYELEKCLKFPNIPLHVYKWFINASDVDGKKAIDLYLEVANFNRILAEKLKRKILFLE